MQNIKTQDFMLLWRKLVTGRAHEEDFVRSLSQITSSEMYIFEKNLLRNINVASIKTKQTLLKRKVFPEIATMYFLVV